MKYREIINEKVEELSMGTKVFVNPSKNQIANIGDDIRMLVTNNDVFAWDGEKAIHREVEEELGIDNSVSLVISEEEPRVIDIGADAQLTEVTGAFKILKNNDYFTKLFQGYVFRDEYGNIHEI